MKTVKPTLIIPRGWHKHRREIRITKIMLCVLGCLLALAILGIIDGVMP